MPKQEETPVGADLIQNSVVTPEDSPESLMQYEENPVVHPQNVDSSTMLEQKSEAAAPTIDQRATTTNLESLPEEEIIGLNKEEELVAPTDNDVVELEKLTVKKGQVTEKIVGLGLKSSYAYAPEQVKDKEKMGWNRLKFWQKNRHSAEDKLRLGHDYVEKDMREKGIPDTIDRSLSIREATVFVNEETDTVTVSFKGTNFMNVQDVAADVALYDNKVLKLGVGALSPKSRTVLPRLRQ